MLLTRRAREVCKSRAVVDTFPPRIPEELKSSWKPERKRAFIFSFFLTNQCNKQYIFDWLMRA